MGSWGRFRSVCKFTRVGKTHRLNGVALRAGFIDFMEVQDPFEFVEVSLTLCSPIEGTRKE
jgi:hypothetical protein